MTKDAAGLHPGDAEKRFQCARFPAVANHFRRHHYRRGISVLLNMSERTQTAADL